jgi:hypothetical protein
MTWPKERGPCVSERWEIDRMGADEEATEVRVTFPSSTTDQQGEGETCTITK